MKSFQSVQRKPLIAGSFWLILYYLATTLSSADILLIPGMPISIVWFPIGVATCAFLYTRRQYWLFLFIGFIVINTPIRQLLTTDYLYSFFYSTLSIIPPLIIALIVRRYAMWEDDLQVLLLWLSTTLVVSFFDALLFSVGLYLDDGSSIKDIFLAGLISDISGIIFTSTVILGFLNFRFRSPGLFKKNLFSGLVLLILLCMSTLFIFNDSIIFMLPGFSVEELNFFKLFLLCIPILFSVMLSIVWGNRGGALALVALATITIYYTGMGQGPFFLTGLYAPEHLLILQGYITLTALLMLFLRIFTHIAQVQNKKSSFVPFKCLAYQLDLHNKALEWGDTEKLLPNMSGQILNNATLLLDRVHKDDRDKVYNHWFGIDKENILPSINFRLKDGYGHWRNIEDKGSLFMEQDGAKFIIGHWYFTEYL